MKKNNFIAGAILLLAFTLILSGCVRKMATPAPQPVKKFKVAFVYPGTVNDAGWSQAHDRGRKYLQTQLPDVETSFMEAVNETDAERVLVELAEKGNRVIFAAYSGYEDAVLKVAPQYPGVVFMICSGDQTAPNVGTYDGRMYQPRYLSGLVAGSMTTSNLIGYVALSPTPDAIRDINAFTLGVRAMDAKAKVRVAWTNNYLELQRERDAIKNLLQDGADLIMQQRDDPSVQQPAAEHGTLFIGSNGDPTQLLSGADLVSLGWNWGPIYETVVRDVQDGTWRSGHIWGSISDHTVDLAPLSLYIPANIRQLVDAKRQQIISGKWDVFMGPLQDQQGQTRVKANQNITDAELMSMEWFVPGVEEMPTKK